MRTRLAVALAAALLTSGCGFLDAVAHPEELQDATTSSTPPAPAAPTTTAGPDVIAQAELRWAGDGSSAGSLAVTVGKVQTGLIPPFHEFAEDCPVSGPSLQYVPVILSFGGAAAAGPAGRLAVIPGPSTPGDIGDVGVFFRPGDEDDEYCRDYPPLPSTDTFWSHGAGGEATGYVVLDQAVTAATPQGRADVFPTLQARIGHLRVRDPDTQVERALTLGTVGAGTTCPDDPGAFCISLG